MQHQIQCFWEDYIHCIEMAARKARNGNGESESEMKMENAYVCVCVWSKVCRIQYLTWPSRLVFIVLGVPQNDWQCTDILFPICAQRSYCRPCEFQFSVSQFASVQLFILFACLFIFLFSHLLPLRRMTISHFKK